jgi:hypothetical protein
MVQKKPNYYATSHENQLKSNKSVEKEQVKAIYGNKQTLNIRVIAFINHSHHVCVIIAAGH